MTELPKTQYTDLHPKSHHEKIKKIKLDPKVKELSKLLDDLMLEYDYFSSVEDMLYSLELL